MDALVPAAEPGARRERLGDAHALALTAGHAPDGGVADLGLAHVPEPKDGAERPHELLRELAFADRLDLIPTFLDILALALPIPHRQCVRNRAPNCGRRARRSPTGSGHLGARCEAKGLVDGEGGEVDVVLLAVDNISTELVAEVVRCDAGGVVHEAVDGVVGFVLVGERFEEGGAACARAAKDDCVCVSACSENGKERTHGASRLARRRLRSP